MKKVIISIFATIWAFSTAYAQTPDSIFNKFFDATGGEAAWKGVTSYTLKQAYRTNTTADYDVDIKASLPDKFMSKTKTIMKRDFIYGVNGTDGWLKIPMGGSDKMVKYDTKDLDDGNKQAMFRELQDFTVPFLNYQQKGYIATYVGAETNAGKTWQHVELTGKIVKYDLYFDDASGLLMREKQSLSTGELITKDYTTYAQSAGGLKYPSEGTYYSSLDKKNFKVTSTMTFNDKLDMSALKR